MRAECIEWQGRHSTPNGYGRVRIGGKLRLAHRVAYELEHGPIPDGLFVCHSCDNPPCINPDHLWLGTPADNMRDMNTKGRHHNLHGESAPNSKLTREQVVAIRNDTRAQTVIAAEYGVTQSNISRIKGRVTWRQS